MWPALQVESEYKTGRLTSTFRLLLPLNQGETGSNGETIKRGEHGPKRKAFRAMRGAGRACQLPC